MRVLCVSPHFPSEKKPYYCIYLLQQIKCMQKDGAEVSVLIPDRNLPSGQSKKEIFEGVQIYRIGYSEYSLHGIINCVSKKFRYAAENLVKKLAPDIISLNLCNLALTRFFLKRKINAIPVVIHLHGLNVWHEYKRAYPFFARLDEFERKIVYRKADGIIGVSQKVCDFVKQHIDSNKVFKVYNGADTSMFYPEKREKEPNSPFVIGCIANLIKIKGQEYLLKAVKDAKKELGVDIITDIIGSGSEKENLIKLAEELGISDCVNFCGEWLYPDIAKYLRERCDFFIMPSYFEALGCVYLEAMASGVAVLGIKNCGIDEIIENEISGYLADAKNSGQVKTAIIEAVTNTEKFEDIAKRGYKEVAEKYTWENSAKALLDAYKAIINLKQ